MSHSPILTNPGHHRPRDSPIDSIIFSYGFQSEYPQKTSSFSVSSIFGDLKRTAPLMLTDKIIGSSPVPIKKNTIIGVELADEIRNANSSPRERGKRLNSEMIMLFRDPNSPLTAQGTYFVKNRATGDNLGIFKPADEETGVEPRRKTSLSHVMMRGIIAGDAAIKERAAFLLDYDSLAGVPQTDLATIDDGSDLEHFGSLQAFCEHVCTSEDYGPSKYDVENVHAIALLDLRLFNLDRHEGNLLVNQCNNRLGSTYKLTPIDHGFSLPSFRTLSDAMFCWTDWRQVKLPLSAKMLEYIGTIAPLNDIVPLKRIGLRDECIMTYILCTRYVQLCALAERTLFEMASSMQVDFSDDNSISAFETLVQKSSHDAEFDEFVFDDDQNTWSCEAVQRFLDIFDLNIGFACHNVSCRQDDDPFNLPPSSPCFKLDI